MTIKHVHSVSEHINMNPIHEKVAVKFDAIRNSRDSTTMDQEYTSLNSFSFLYYWNEYKLQTIYLQNTLDR